MFVIYVRGHILPTLEGRDGVWIVFLHGVDMQTEDTGFVHTDLKSVCNGKP